MPLARPDRQPGCNSHTRRAVWQSAKRAHAQSLPAPATLRARNTCER